MTSEAVLQILSRLATPSDIVILTILLVNFLIGCWRGLTRTLFGLFGKIGALLLATYAARAVAPIMANFLILPIVGGVFRQQAQTVLEGSNISTFLQKLMETEAVQTATEPLTEAAGQAAQQMANSLAYFLLFAIFLCACSMVIRMIGEALHFLTDRSPLSTLNALGGGVIGLICGAILCILILWVLTMFAPAMFTELGVLSPAACEKTLLTRAVLDLISGFSAFSITGM